MTKQQLSQYRHILKEIKTTESEIDRLIRKKERLPVVKDKVQASMEEFPYTRTHITVDAYDPLKADTIEVLLVKKRRLLDRLNTERIRIEEFIQSIGDSRTRQVVYAVYVEGKSQQETAMSLYVDQSTVSRMINAVFDSA